MNNNITVKDVAKAAGVSIATVSRVINQNYPVSDELKIRVNDAIRELNYYPNSVARSLRPRRHLPLVLWCRVFPTRSLQPLCSQLKMLSENIIIYCLLAVQMKIKKKS